MSATPHDAKVDKIREAIGALSSALRSGEPWTAHLSLVKTEAMNYVDELLPLDASMLDFARERYHLKRNLRDSREQLDDLHEQACDLFNPSDDDSTTIESILDDAHQYIVGTPCHCTEAMIEDHDPCARCRVLGRLGNEPVSR